jgi:hypothetical protein
MHVGKTYASHLASNNTQPLGVFWPSFQSQMVRYHPSPVVMNFTTWVDFVRRRLLKSFRYEVVVHKYFVPNSSDFLNQFQYSFMCGCSSCANQFSFSSLDTYSCRMLTHFCHRVYKFYSKSIFRTNWEKMTFPLNFRINSPTDV